MRGYDTVLSQDRLCVSRARLVSIRHASTSSWTAYTFQSEEPNDQLASTKDPCSSYKTNYYEGCISFYGDTWNINPVKKFSLV
jgi:hypothetical protein